MDTRPVIRRFEIVVLKDKGGATNPKEQVPAAAQVDFYRQGATVSANATIPSFCSVYNRGSLVGGDFVVVNLGTTVFIVQDPLEGDPEDRVRLTGGPPTSVVKGDRLHVVNNRPTPAHPTGEPASTNNFITTSSVDGRASCYIAAPRWDYVVSGTGLTTRLFIDAEGSFVMR